MKEIFQKIKGIQSRSSSNISRQNISVMLAIQMSLEFIESESPEIINVLRHLCLCPSGLSDHHIKAIWKDWNKWLDLLKDRSLVNEIEIFDEDFNKTVKPEFMR